MAPYDLSCLDVVAVVGEPFNPEAWHWTYEKLGKGRIYVNNTWGQTELVGCPLAGAAWLTPMKPGSCGSPFLGAELDVVDDAGRVAAAQRVGQPRHPAAVSDDAANACGRSPSAIVQQLLLAGATAATSPTTPRSRTTTATSGSPAASTT